MTGTRRGSGGGTQRASLAAPHKTPRALTWRRRRCAAASTLRVRGHIHCLPGRQGHFLHRFACWHGLRLGLCAYRVRPFGPCRGSRGRHGWARSRVPDFCGAFDEHLCVCVCVCVSYVCAFMYVCVFMWVHANRCIGIDVHMNIYVYIKLCIRECMHICINTCMFLCTYMHICIHVHFNLFNHMRRLRRLWRLIE